ncbi:MAG: hypothetical protein EPO10_10975, partial [Reyranella sp.]
GISNPPSGNALVSIGGNSNVAVTACNPCVTVGLTPEVIGQFATVGLPSRRPDVPGLVRWTQTADPFPNPYGASPGNNATREYGVNFTVALTPNGGGAPLTVTTGALLDTGTPSFGLASSLSAAGTTATYITMTGVNPDGTAIPGLTTTSANLNPYYGTYHVGNFNSENTSILGLPFFMQNSVLFDLSNRAIGYTPFFVTDAPLATTALGPLSVTSSNLQLGLAGVISGLGGVNVGAGAAIQVSATNTYTGVTNIADGGRLNVAGPGSIALSSGVTNDGVFDISRAWAPVTISSLTGAATGLVSLGGNALTIANANGTYSGNLSDGGAYPLAGGSLTIAGGTQTLAGASTYTGGTFVNGGILNLTGTMVGSLGIQSGAVFSTTGGYSVAANAILANAGTYIAEPGTGPLLNQGLFLNSGAFLSGLNNTGTMVNNGTIVGDVTNSGTMSGIGAIAGNVVNSGTVSPGNSIGTLNVVGSYTQAAGSSYVVETNAQGQSDLINATGTAVISGLSGAFWLPDGSMPLPPGAVRSTSTIMSASGGVTGRFSSVTSLAGNLPFVLPSLSYDANNAYLTLQVGGFARQALTPNQAAVGSVLDVAALGATGDFATVLSGFSAFNTQQGVAAMNTISGQNYSAFSSVGIATTQIFMTNFANTVGGTSGGGKRVALAEACDVACDTTEPGRWGAWGGALGGFGVVGGTANAGTLTYNLGGFAAGIDRRLTPDLLVGV